MKVIFFTKYAEVGASSRVRSYNYKDVLISEGWKPEFLPLLGDIYLARRYKNVFPVFNIVQCYMNRTLQLLRLIFCRSDVDIVVIEKELFPFVPFFLEQFLCKKFKFIIDIDDAVFLNYQMSSSGFVRKAFGNKIFQLAKNSSAVTCGSHSLLLAFEQINVPKYYIPSVLPVNQIATQIHGRRTRIVGWIGSPSSFKNLRAYLDEILLFCSEYHYTLVVMGAGESAKGVGEIAGFINFLPWDETNEKKLLNEMDIGIMPLMDAPFEQAKCGYKIIQYFGAGAIPVVSPVGQNKILVNDCSDGFFANKGEWLDVLGKVARLQELEKDQIRLRGWEKAKSKYSVEVEADNLCYILNKSVRD